MNATVYQDVVAVKACAFPILSWQRKQEAVAKTNAIHTDSDFSLV
jgi:hypothetical protein